jgi:hypothetical protein
MGQGRSLLVSKSLTGAINPALGRVFGWITEVMRAAVVRSIYDRSYAERR